jgi:hypothetical protein
MLPLTENKKAKDKDFTKIQRECSYCPKSGTAMSKKSRIMM